ncbi:MAG: hypothetical protein M0R46_13615 [Candidatus Muirbacterium halophilum]|nr:hypothetical protein [Candidatus Muirbacterium halophilum]
MKVKEVMEKYRINRCTLSNWLKKSWIEFRILSSGRYIYHDLVYKNKQKENKEKENKENGII